MGEYTTLAIPGFILFVFAVKFLIHRCYAKREERLREERLRTLEYILRRDPRRPHHSDTRSRSDAPPSPPPEFESALRTSIAVIYVDDEPPPTYEEYQKTQEMLRSSSITTDAPVYTPNAVSEGDRDRRAFRGDGDIL